MATGLEIVREAIELTLLTGQLEGEQPGSLMITSEIEESKSFVVSHYASLPGVAYLSDATAYGIVKEYCQDLLEGRLKHLIFPELIRPLERPKETAASLVAFLAELMEEGVKEIRTYATSFQLPRPVKAGVIACIARGNLKWRTSYWNEAGFLSRFLVLSYTFGLQTETGVLEAIIARAATQLPAFALPAPETVDLPEPLARQLAAIAKPLAKALYPPLHGFRMQKHLQRLAMASALRDGRDVVKAEDLDVINELVPYLNLQYQQL
ncbi:MAG: hypothetical protein WBF66_07295 [Dehalococcoidia bacterium]